MFIFIFYFINKYNIFKAVLILTQLKLYPAVIFNAADYLFLNLIYIFIYLIYKYI